MGFVSTVIGALIGSTIAGIIIYYWSESKKNRNLIAALKQELETNRALIEFGINKSLEMGKIVSVYFYFDVFEQIRKNNLIIRRIGSENYSKLVSLYNKLRLIDRVTDRGLLSIELGLKTSVLPKEIEKGWKELINEIQNLINNL